MLQFGFCIAYCIAHCSFKVGYLVGNFLIDLVKFNWRIGIHLQKLFYLIVSSSALRSIRNGIYHHDRLFKTLTQSFSHFLQKFSTHVPSYLRDVTMGKIQMRPLQWWAESAPPGGDRVKVSQNLGATWVAPVAPADTSLNQFRRISTSFQNLFVVVFT